MARATIPYEDLRAKAETLFPYPTYDSVSLRKPTRYDDYKAPTTVYDRSTGNFQRIGYRCYIRRTRIEGFSEDFRPIWKTEGSYVILEV
jgi:hypothetical protein